MRGLIYGFMVVLLWSGAGWADIVATYETDDQSTGKLSIRDDRHIRIDTDEKDTYLLMIDQKVYMVHKQDGQWTAVDMDQMASMMQRFGQSEPTPGGGPSDKGSTAKLRDTGRNETIAGYKGRVYELEDTDTRGRKYVEEVVFSDHKDIRKIYSAWVMFSSRMQGKLNGMSSTGFERSLGSAKMEKYGGILRIGNEFALKQVERKPLKASFYELPSGAQLQQSPNRGTAQMPERNSSQDNQNGYVEETAAQAGEAAKEEAQDSTVESVRKGVKGLFNKMW